MDGCYACASKAIRVGTSSAILEACSIMKWRCEKYWIKCVHWLSTLDHRLVFPGSLLYQLLSPLKLYFSCL